MVDLFASLHFGHVQLHWRLWSRGSNLISKKIRLAGVVTPLEVNGLLHVIQVPCGFVDVTRLIRGYRSLAKGFFDIAHLALRLPSLI